MNFSTLRGQTYGVEHLLSSFSGAVDEILEKQLKLDLKQIHFLRSLGSIYVNEKRCLQNVQIDEGTYLRVHQNPRRFPIELFRWPEQKIFEDQNLVVINKPSGLPVPATVDNIQENLAALLTNEIGKKILVTHRLDMGTSGLLIFAKNKTAQAEINQKLMGGEVQKYYRALVHGVNLPTGEWVHYMQPSPRAPKIVSPVQKPGWAQCRLRIIDQTEVFRGHSEVIIELITGRTHQIRAQMSANGFPIVGDQAYGSPVKLADHEEICLQAFYLSFENENETLMFRISESPWKNSAALSAHQKLN